jgi:hypothetical protein
MIAAGVPLSCRRSPLFALNCVRFCNNHSLGLQSS